MEGGVTMRTMLCFVVALGCGSVAHAGGSGGHFHVGDDHLAHYVGQLTVLLAVSFLLVAFFRTFRGAALPAEILAGVLLGQTVFARVAPDAFQFVFPNEVMQSSLLQGTLLLAMLLYLLRTGLELKPEDVRCKGRDALAIGLIGSLLPAVSGVLLTLGFCWITDFSVNTSVWVFALFCGVSMSTSAMAVSVRLLDDEGLREATHMGKAIICAYAVDDVMGWVLFSFVFDYAATGAVRFPFSLILALLLGLLAFLYLRKWLDSGLSLLGKLGHDRWILVPVLVFAFTTSLCARWFGLTLFFGMFFSGLLLSECKAFTPRARLKLTEFARQVLVPLYFVQIGFQVDFIAHFEWRIVVFYGTAAIGLKFISAFLGARKSTRPRVEWIPIGISFIPSGITEIVLGQLALDRGIIDHRFFVAIVTTAIVSSMLAGPLLRASMGDVVKMVSLKLESLLKKDSEALSSEAHPISQIFGKDREAALQQLCNRAAIGCDIDGGFRAIRKAIEDRKGRVEEVFGAGVAFPHAKMHGLSRPIIRIGWSDKDIAWAPKYSVRIVILLLLPAEQHALALAVERSIALLVGRMKEAGLYASGPRQGNVKKGVVINRVRDSILGAAHQVDLANRK